MFCPICKKRVPAICHECGGVLTDLEEESDPDGDGSCPDAA